MKRLVTIGALILIAGASAAAQQKAAPGGDEAAIRQIASAYQTATQDPAALAKFYTPDGIEMPPNAPAAKGRAAIEAYHKALAQQVMVHGLTITSTETRVLGDRAYDVGTYKQQLMSTTGGGIVEDHGKYVVLMKKDASGKWWITHAIYNSDVPVTPPAKK